MPLVSSDWRPLCYGEYSVGHRRCTVCPYRQGCADLMRVLISERIILDGEIYGGAQL
jgi:hypothetical protein